ncbi:uncharacterized protein LOC124808505 [Hydra vulgaris]|uniref:uncharacterized protein LOC124808505 n=1 Tax=Hydra vulgaris TaxID=6087 RepID=UPI001F5EC898|nr:uncharacterized protein LOC124808505 [Hydra vulgaris]
MSKARVRPLQSISIPRLELLGAVLGLRLAEKIITALNWKLKTQKLKPFVANRVGFIQSKTELKQWRYIPTKTNVADLLTTGTTVKELETNKGIKWHFNAPLELHLGGVFEIMVKAVKRAVTGILKKADIKNEKLCTAFTGAENLLNSRPLTYQSADIKGNIPLTPKHFLIGQVGRQFAPDSVQSKGYHPKKRWHRVQELIRHFWKKWMRERLPSLD